MRSILGDSSDRNSLRETQIYIDIYREIDIYRYISIHIERERV